MSKYTVVLNTDNGYYTYKVEADYLGQARETAIKIYRDSYAAQESDRKNVSVVIVISGWPEIF